jgi:hypothetical protein
MSRLAWVVYVMAAPTIGGILVTALLASGMYSGVRMLIALAVGFVAAIPVAMMVGKAIAGHSRG